MKNYKTFFLKLKYGDWNQNTKLAFWISCLKQYGGEILKMAVRFSRSGSAGEKYPCKTDHEVDMKIREKILKSQDFQRTANCLSDVLFIELKKRMEIIFKNMATSRAL